ncbi:MerR family transcriptional regulator [Priestia aryabhattai]|uniref:HTH-type transcriptional regulator AdhR n=1 Tax=Priestia megaterium Q3 TaxID=1452722 RepID=A0A806TH56_PRIMG|nr:MULTISPECIES: MerR family transcriptional regulator [Priestia]AKP76768.1 HTH-type transcriptional regulator AdhR [Priestia megaterium Q3]MCM2979103.1 MerR family transcriptional regulator [Priestia aryabhattai]MED3923248.1 MerR family transcriptional regulator [Priestia aryabhattai]MED3955817.1 MerR family transcriptional regulator [Priestia aryabhattai]MED3988056.1 MerR family transcriptional regulator [Priestia aryabhattai]
MEKLLAIQNISSITGLSTYTLRYYENIGLLSNIERDENGYRTYRQTDILWIDFLIKLRKTGMPIINMKKFAELRRQGDSTATARRELLEIHQENVLKQIKELESNLTKISEKIDYYKKLEEKI